MKTLFSNIPITFALVLLKLSAGVISVKDFAYDGQQGPKHWGDEYKRCSGKHQSPINIDALNVVEFQFQPIIFEYFTNVPTSIKIINNGHTVQVKMTYDTNPPKIHGGPLGFFIEGYQFEQFHFHWGANDTIGSEDLINNSSFPAELHVVMRNLKYKDFENALGKDDGVVVLAYFFEINSKDNPSYVKLTDALTHIPVKGMAHEFTEFQGLIEYLSFDNLNYYTYIGSLTTPPCSEDVVWIDFIEPIAISEQQLNRFRDLAGDDHLLMNNFRPTQPLNDRQVFKSTLSLPPSIDKEDSIPFVDAANFVDVGVVIYPLLVCLCAALSLGIS